MYYHVHMEDDVLEEDGPERHIKVVYSVLMIEKQTMS